MPLSICIIELIQSWIVSKAQCHVIFFDFPIVFDIVKPARLAEKLSVIQVDQDLVA